MCLVDSKVSLCMVAAWQGPPARRAALTARVGPPLGTRHFTPPEWEGTAFILQLKRSSKHQIGRCGEGGVGEAGQTRGDRRKPGSGW